MFCPASEARAQSASTEQLPAGQPQGLVIIISYGLYSDEEIAELRPRVVFVDEKNRIKECVEVDLDALD